MFREIRRKKQALGEAAAIEILKRHTAGVLGVSGDEGYPYTVPVSYAYQDGKLFFHCARKGHKLDGIRRNDKVSFCVIDQDQVIPEKFTTHYRSAIAFGRARILEDAAERQQAMECLVERISPGLLEEGRREIESAGKKLCVVEIRIEHLTAKAALELVQDKE